MEIFVDKLNILIQVYKNYLPQVTYLNVQKM
jgi:hypothetical protein